ncbi:hypothetical protein AAL_02647 [Moelleriella libera RCEF 2490]|uniref:DUF3074 domain-containing protein n=1 Tax=Moelleriella libera RCEF 2490 TaxID=1081109 RepID=A0A168ES88_9HYPO|nr:hypothetical protein AAL_02647 [Moelleriella libera RCEF 2490]
MALEGNDQLGHLVRLWGVNPETFPRREATPEELAPTLQRIIEEAVPFIEDIPPPDSSSKCSPWKHNGVKKFPHSAAPVNLYKRVVPARDLKKVAQNNDFTGVRLSKIRRETWSLRRSVHADAEAPKTASWDEWYHCFKNEHALAEMAFTKTVEHTQRVQEWRCDGVQVVQGQHTWGSITMVWEESTHKLPAPLSKRVFPVLQITATDEKNAHGTDFIVVQIAVNDNEIARRYGAVRGAYTSVERIRGTSAGIEWIMGTVSDAKGVLPACIQQMAVPGQIAADVDMFLAWIAKERETQSEHFWTRRPTPRKAKALGPAIEFVSLPERKQSTVEDKKVEGQAGTSLPGGSRSLFENSSKSMPKGVPNDVPYGMSNSKPSRGPSSTASLRLAFEKEADSSSSGPYSIENPRLALEKEAGGSSSGPYSTENPRLVLRKKEASESSIGPYSIENPRLV